MVVTGPYKLLESPNKMDFIDDTDNHLQSIYDNDDDYNETGVRDETDNDLDETAEKSNKKKASVESMTRRTKYFACLILCIGMIASGGFLGVGIKAIRDGQEEEFNRNAANLVQRIESAWNDYESAGLWIHESCRARNFSRTDFLVLYEHLTAGGLNFQAAQFVINVTGEERNAYESESKAFYSQFYPTAVNYTGFRGFEPSPLNPNETIIANRSEQPFYYVIHYTEPVVPNVAAIDFDNWSSPGRRLSIQQALDTWKATLTPRLRLVQETETNAYSVVLYHPGIPLQSQPLVKPGDVSVIVIRIPSLLTRSIEAFNRKMKVYIYDSTTTTTNGTATAVFLGAVALASNEAAAGAKVEFLPEIEFQELQSQFSGRVSTVFFEQKVQVASRQWTIAIVNSEDTDQSQMVIVVLGGLVIFQAAALLFFWMVRHIRRTTELHRIAAVAEAGNLRIVRELFPSSVLDRLVTNAAAGTAAAGGGAADTTNGPQSSRRRSRNAERGAPLVHDEKNDLEQPLVKSGRVFVSAPIADLFPNVTIMFGDIVGFTAWSSVREPTQVFILLETLYNGFDEIAKRRRIFKVETIGDCYVAAAGVPEARKDHAVAMARFAAECLRDMRVLTKELETLLGPDTGDLQMRIGLHSGEVTAGVLRGLKGRFQLFGDSMNTASRMESTGLPNKTQVSQETATLICQAGKAHWLSPRSDKVLAKGKGELETYWLDVNTDNLDGTSHSGTGGDNNSVVKEVDPITTTVSLQAQYDANIARLVGWNVEAMCRMLRDILVKRIAMGKNAVDVKMSPICPEHSQKTILECATDSVVLLPPGASPAIHSIDSSSIELDPQVVDEVKSLVSSIASYYRNVPFHNFEHASHVGMSVVKLLGRIVKSTEPAMQLPPTPSGGVQQQQSSTTTANLHDFTTLVSSDPMTHFACFFTALVHDMDHQGVPNATLVKEESVLAKIYKGKSVAEQNSVAITWELLQEDKYRNLRKCIYSDKDEMLRFRQLLVNLVMATDVMDKDLGAIRRERWERAFNSETTEAVKRLSESGIDEGHHLSQLANCKAMIVLEHVIQASDVSHTMQHWHVFRKWNERLFQEMYKAFEDGRIDKDPSENWYESEIGFFDFYVIPLAKKLAKCQVFSVSSDELMNYAIRNRQEWHQKGKEMVQNYLLSYLDQ